MANRQIASAATQSRGVALTSPRIRALILDDDEWALRLIRYVLEESLPGIEIEERETPDTTGDFDIYIVDNDFGGARWAAQIVPSKLGVAPSAIGRT